MAFVQNIVANCRRRFHARARGHGRCIRPCRAAVEYASPSSGSHRTDSDTAANRQHHAIAQPNATISGGWSTRLSDGHPSSNGLRPSKGAALSSSDSNASRDPPDRTTDAEPTPNGDPHARFHTDADRQSLRPPPCPPPEGDGEPAQGGYASRASWSAGRCSTSAAKSSRARLSTLVAVRVRTVAVRRPLLIAAISPK
jgi:hypothetical protein